jgi:hypothetical protein
MLLDLEITFTGIVCVINPMIADLREPQPSLFPSACQQATVEMQLVLVLHDLSIVKGQAYAYETFPQITKWGILMLAQ